MSSHHKQPTSPVQEVSLFNFLEQIPSIWSSATVVCLRGEEYSVLYCSLLMHRLKKMGIPVESLDSETLSVSEIISKLEMSFLGMRGYYWLRDISVLAAKDRKQLLAYLEQYQGPHNLIFFTSEAIPAKKPQQWLLVSLEKTLNQQHFVRLFALENPTAARRAMPMISALFARYATLSLDNACMMMRYLSLVSPHDTPFFTQWVDELLVQDQSLFTLTTHFFARDTQKFFAAWATMKDLYAEPFWLTFWSEQLWRSAHYISFMQRKDVAEAKKIGFRLPFSFMQRDWKKSRTDELIAAHDFIYAMDHGFKNGGLFWIELFYTKFFEGKFKKSVRS